MKLQHLFLMTAVAAMAVISCSKEEPAAEVSLKVTPEALSFEAAGGSQTLSVVTSADWTVQGASYFSLDKTSGKADATVKVTAPAATSTEAVEETITFKAGDKAVSVKLTQKGKDKPTTGISVEPSSLEFPAADAKTVTVTVDASDSWTLSKDASWVLAPIKSGAKGKSEIAISVEDNEGGERTSVVTFTCGTATATLTVKQDGFKDPLKITSVQEFIDEIIKKPHNAYRDPENPGPAGTVYSMDTTYVVMTDLDFSGYEIVPAGTATTAKQIEIDMTNHFYCNVDFNNKKIKNLRSKCALFYATAAVIKNVTIDSSCSCELLDRAGALLVQTNSGGKLINITNYGSVTYSNEGTSTQHIGAIVGVNRAYVEDCKNYGTVSYASATKAAQTRLGGLIGTNSGGSQNHNGILTPEEYKLVVKNCENHGKIVTSIPGTSGKDTYMGGIIGFMDGQIDGVVENCKNDAEISYTGGTTDAGLYIGGIVACYKYANAISCPILNCENSGKLDGGATGKGIGGLIGYLYNGPKSAEAPFTFIQGGKSTGDVISGTVATVSSDNPCGKAGLVFGWSNDKAQTIYAGTTAASVQVSGNIICGETKVTATAANVSALVCGSDVNRTNVEINASLAK